MTSQQDKLQLVPILVWDLPESKQSQAPGYEQQKMPFGWGKPSSTKVTEVDLEGLQDAYGRIQQQINTLFSRHDSSPAGWAVSKVTVRLGISAKGGLAFVAEAGIEAALEVTFSREGSST